MWRVLLYERSIEFPVPGSVILKVIRSCMRADKSEKETKQNGLMMICRGNRLSYEHVGAEVHVDYLLDLKRVWNFGPNRCVMHTLHKSTIKRLNMSSHK